MQSLVRYFGIFILLLGIFASPSCSSDQLEQKGFSVPSTRGKIATSPEKGINKDSLDFATRPGNMLLTGNQPYRITPVYMVNYNERTERYFIGSNYFHSNYGGIGHSDSNNWNNNFLPGLEAMHGYNMVGASLFYAADQSQTALFESPVLIKTLYYPTTSKDTLFGKAVKRDYYMASVYNEDTNGDGFINLNDLRRFYWFNRSGELQEALINEQYSVLKSEYDPYADRMMVFAQLDENENGQRDHGEQEHIFWIDLKNPGKRGVIYKPES